MNVKNEEEYTFYHFVCAGKAYRTYSDEKKSQRALIAVLLTGSVDFNLLSNQKSDKQLIERNLEKYVDQYKSGTLWKIKRFPLYPTPFKKNVVMFLLCMNELKKNKKMIVPKVINQLIVGKYADLFVL